MRYLLKIDQERPSQRHILMMRLSFSFLDTVALRSLVFSSRPLTTAAGTWFNRPSAGLLDGCTIYEHKPSTTGRDCGHAWTSGPQLRGYKSNKKSLKPLNTASSWRAAEPFLPVKSSQSKDGSQPPIIDSAVPEAPEVPKPVPFHRLGVITGQYTLELQKVRTHA